MSPKRTRTVMRGTNSAEMLMATMLDTIGTRGCLRSSMIVCKVVGTPEGVAMIRIVGLGLPISQSRNHYFWKDITKMSQKYKDCRSGVLYTAISTLSRAADLGRKERFGSSVKH